jgi:hypothetical protein
MAEWEPSSFKKRRLKEMQEATLILKDTEVMGWHVLATSEHEPWPRNDEVMSFAHFHDYGFGLPVHHFL